MRGSLFVFILCFPAFNVKGFDGWISGNLLILRGSNLIPILCPSHKSIPHLVPPHRRPFFFPKTRKKPLTNKELSGIMQGLNAAEPQVHLFKPRNNGRKAEEGYRMEMLKNAASRVVGTKQVLRGIKAGTLAKVYVANDADTFIFQQVVRAADAARVPVQRVPTMKELGRTCGVETAAAAAGILK